MGSNDIPPPHIPSHVVPISNFFLQLGGGLWTIAYVLYARESFRSRSYGMPLFAMALNFAWELVYALYVAESLLEKSVFASWLVIDCFMVYGLVKSAKYEWSHSPWVARNVGLIFAVLTTFASVGHWAFAKWWIDNEMGKREGKYYRGVVGPDTSELGYWSAAVCQVTLSAASLAQILVRQHSGGVSWAIWLARTLGSVIGFYAVYGWDWFFWPEAHGYFVSPFGVFMCATALLCDIVYGFALWQIRKTEVIDSNGRKTAGKTASSVTGPEGPRKER